jgi:hypothetical protein
VCQPGIPIMKTLSFLTHQEIFDKAARHLFSEANTGARPTGSRTYRELCGGCPIGNLIAPSDYTISMGSIPVLFIGAAARVAPSYMDAGITALKRALLRSRINVYNPSTIELLVCLQNVHHVNDKWEWRDGLGSIAQQFGLCADLLEHAA